MAKVLVVDDHAAGRYLLTELLGYHGHTVVEAADGAEGLSMVEAERPDLVITDLLMPVMDGYELVRELRAIPGLAATKVIFYTAYYLLDEAQPLAEALGVERILVKPAEPEALLAAVDSVLSSEVTSVAVGGLGLQREHRRAVNAKLIEKVHQLEAAEASLKENEAMFRSLAESSPIGIFSLNSAWAMTYSNPRLRQICGLAATGEVAPTVWADLIAADDRGRVVDGIRSALATGITYRNRIRLLTPDDEVRWVVMQLTPVGDEVEHRTHVGTLEDVTDMVDAERRRNELEARLRSVERLESLGQLAAGIAHDFNNILGAILNFTHAISSDMEEFARSSPPHARLSRVEDDVASVRTAAQSAIDLTRQLLVFSRREPIQTLVLDANEVVGGAIHLLARTIGENIRLESRLDGALWPVRGDRGRLEQVVVNLVVNARDAIADRGTIVITTDNVEIDEAAAALHPGAMPGRYTRLNVSDDGDGMTSETAAHAFEPFFTTKSAGIGTGLGLATVYGIVKQLNGHIGIYSEPGRGTTVRVYLPRADRVSFPLDLNPAVKPPPAGQGEVILVVDDDQSMRTVSARILAENSYTVVSAESGLAALRWLENPSQRIDLVLTDVVMAEMSGREVAERAERARPGLPVLFMSGQPTGVFVGGTKPAAAVEIVEKPFTRTTLLRSVARVLDRP